MYTNNGELMTNRVVEPVEHSELSSWTYNRFHSVNVDLNVIAEVLNSSFNSNQDWYMTPITLYKHVIILIYTFTKWKNPFVISAEYAAPDFSIIGVTVRNSSDTTDIMMIKRHRIRRWRMSDPNVYLPTGQLKVRTKTSGFKLHRNNVLFSFFGNVIIKIEQMLPKKEKGIQVVFGATYS